MNDFWLGYLVASWIAVITIGVITYIRTRR